jgi:hypothetical protein
LPKSEDDKGWIPSRGNAEIISASANNWNKGKHHAQSVHLQECHSKGTGGFQETLAPALASDRNIEVEHNAMECHAFIRGSVPEREDYVRKIQSGGNANIISVGTNDWKRGEHDAQA